jgi:WD40 repeat protein
VRLWDVASGTQTHALALDADVGLSLAFSPDGQLLAVGQRLARISLWTPSGERKAELVGPHTSEVAAVAFSRDGKRLASGDADGHVVLWDVAGRQVSQVLEGHTGRVVSVEFSADGGLLLSAGDDGTARLWALDEGQEVARFVAPGPLHSARFSPDGARVATAGADGLTRLWTRPALVHPAAEIFERARCRVPVHLDRERLVAGSGCEAPK